MSWSNTTFARITIAALLCTSFITAPFVLCGCTNEKAKAEQEAHEQAVRDFEEAQERQKEVQELSEQVDQWQEDYESYKNGN